MLNLIFSGWECGVWVGLVLFSACLVLEFCVLVSWCFGGFCILVRIMMFEFGVGLGFCEICYLGVFSLFVGGLELWFSVWF